MTNRKKSLHRSIELPQILPLLSSPMVLPLITSQPQGRTGQNPQGTEVQEKIQEIRVPRINLMNLLRLRKQPLKIGYIELSRYQQNLFPQQIGNLDQGQRRKNLLGKEATTRVQSIALLSRGKNRALERRKTNQNRVINLEV